MPTKKGGGSDNFFVRSYKKSPLRKGQKRFGIKAKSLSSYKNNWNETRQTGLYSAAITHPDIGR